MVGNRAHAPHFPEIVLMAQLAQTSPAPQEKGPIPPIVWLITITQLLGGALLVRKGLKILRSKNDVTTE